MLYELKIPQSEENRNPFTGQFRKGHTPFNKGRKWDDYMSKEKQEKVLSKLSRTGRKYHQNCEAPNAKPIVAIYNGKIVGHFKSSMQAARKMNLQAANIKKVARGERKSCGGLQFKFEKNL